MWNPQSSNYIVFVVCVLYLDFLSVSFLVFHFCQSSQLFPPLLYIHLSSLFFQPIFLFFHNIRFSLFPIFLSSFLIFISYTYPPISHLLYIPPIFLFALPLFLSSNCIILLCFYLQFSHFCLF